MRIADRIARLERAGDADPRMTEAELDAAAGRYEAELRQDGVPSGGTITGAVATWREMVEHTGEAWLQRVYAGMTPADLYA